MIQTCEITEEDFEIQLKSTFLWRSKKPATIAGFSILSKYFS